MNVDEILRYMQQSPPSNDAYALLLMLEEIRRELKRANDKK